MKKGSFRVYFNFGPIGIKIARISWGTTLLNQSVNTVCLFLCGIVMNILEYKRYKYYKTNLCPVYFTCGIFSIVKHLDPVHSKVELQQKGKSTNTMMRDLDLKILQKEFHYLVDENTAVGNFGKDKHGNILAVDYGDFNVNRYNHLNVKWIDYA